MDPHCVTIQKHLPTKGDGKCGLTFMVKIKNHELGCGRLKILKLKIGGFMFFFRPFRLNHIAP